MQEKNPFMYAVKYALFAILTAFTIFALGFAFKGLIEHNSNGFVPTVDKSNSIRLVIDAGHGGEDAGAIAGDGTLEKDLNLEIATLLTALLELNGNDVTMTRESDTLLYDYFDDLEDYTGKKKVYDLKNRLKIASSYENSIYVGIHMNKFSIPKYSGLQVYYSANNDLSRSIASDIRDSVKINLQTENNRNIKKSNGSIYILDNAQIPSVLIECGFLSNEKELELLKSEDYRASLALVLFSALSKYGE
ncbi:MAG: N-acetylmuramoyl-L-alanine amidase [Clostridia bacterium]|nr:N-acetylmuramoyl-L-alanine amidase [Clostridia bacterium]